MSRFEILRTLMSRHRWQLIITYLLFGMEMMGLLLRPLFFGMAIDDLIKGRYDGLIYLCLSHFAYLIVGTIRHKYDTRTYTSIYTSLVTGFLGRRYGKTEVSKLSAHSTLAREFVDFLETDIVYIIEAAFNLLGSIVLLMFYDKVVVVICLSVLIPVTLVTWIYGKKMSFLNRMKNDELEKQVDIISGGNKAAIKKHYNSLRKWQISISDHEAWNFGFMEMMVLLVIGVSLIVSIKITGSQVTAGFIVIISSYIQRFVSALDTIPYTVQRLSSLNDITKRIELEGDDFGDNSTSKQTTIVFPRYVGEIKEAV